MNNQKKLFLALFTCLMHTMPTFSSSGNDYQIISDLSAQSILSSLLSNNSMPNTANIQLSVLTLPQKKYSPTDVKIKRKRKREAQQLILQEMLMDLAKKRYIHEKKTDILAKKQLERINNNGYKFIPGTQLARAETVFENPEVIALNLRYNAIVTSRAEDLIQDYPELLASLRKELPVYLESSDPEIAEEAKHYQAKLEMVEAKRAVKIYRDLMDLYLNTNQAILPQNNHNKFLQYLYQYNNLLKNYPGKFNAKTIKEKNAKYATWYKQAEKIQKHHTQNIDLLKQYYLNYIRHSLNGDFTKFNNQVMPKTLSGNLSRFARKPEKKMVTRTSPKNKNNQSWLHKATQQSQKNNRRKTYNNKNKKNRARKRNKKKTNFNVQKNKQSNKNNNIVTSSSSPSSSSSSTQNKQTKQATSTNQLLIKKYPDDSYVSSETNSMITIIDKKHNATLKLFKLDKPTAHQLPNKTTWTQNIKDWIHAPELAVKTQGYSNPNHQYYTSNKDKLDYITTIHSFPIAADNFINKCGIQQEIKSRKHSGNDIMITMPCAYCLNDKSIIGLLIYIYNPNTKQLFHRMFHTHNAQDLIQEYKANAKWNIDLNKLEI